MQHLVTFGAPRVGDINFANLVNSTIKGLNVRFTLAIDPVPQVPDKINSLYIHAGTEIHFMTAEMQKALSASNIQNNDVNTEDVETQSDSLMSRYKNVNYFIKNYNTDESGSYLHDNFTGPQAKQDVKTSLKNVFNGGLKNLAGGLKQKIKMGIMDHSSYNLVNSSLLIKSFDEYGVRIPKLLRKK